jgi:hypothetical protein
MKTLVNVTGGYVVGERFWGREKELELLLDYIRRKAHLSIIAQRRIGKTSLMREAGDRLGPDHIVLHIDVQEAGCAADMVVKLVSATKAYESLWKKTKTFFENALSSAVDRVESISIYEVEIQLRAGLSGDNWRNKGAQTLDALAGHDKPVVLFIDELPIQIERMLKSDNQGVGAAQDLLTWLRAEALKHQGRLCMVFAGSIGLEPVLHRAGLSANINHLTPFILDPWSDAEALGCLSALAAHCNLDLPKPAARLMLERLGCNIPHHVQLFFAKVWEECVKSEQTRCSVEMIEGVFKSKMLSTQGHVELTHMEERLRKALDDAELPLAMDILTQAAVEGALAPPKLQLLCDRHNVDPPQRPQRLTDLFLVLEHDGYLTKNATGEYVFVSELLRQWWKARHEAFFELV